MSRVVFMLIVGVAFSSVAFAQSQDDWSVCTDRFPFGKEDATITACTIIIDSGQESGARLAQAYLGRGFAKSLKAVSVSNKDEVHMQAVADLDKVLELTPNNGEALGLRAGVNYDLRNYATVITDLENERTLNSDHTDLVKLAHAYEHAGQFEKAAALYDALLKQDPKNDDLYENRGEFYQRNGSPRLAVRDYSKALDIRHKSYFDSSDALLIYKRGFAKRAAGDEKGAQADIAKANSLYPDMGTEPPKLDY